MRSRALASFALAAPLAVVALALVALAAMGASLSLAGCADDCAPDCGDCLSCGLVADATPAPPQLADLVRCGLASAPALVTASTAPGTLDHVPLAAAA
jgi:hypothetical protein